MYRLAITIALIVSILGVSGCTPNVKLAPVTQIGCGNYYAKKLNKMPNINFVMDNGEVFDSDNLEENITIIFIASGVDSLDTPVIEQLQNSLPQLTTLQTKLYIFGSGSPSIIQREIDNCTIYAQQNPGPLPATLSINQLPALVMVDSHKKQIRWIAQGNSPNMVTDLLVALAIFADENSNKDALKTIGIVVKSVVITYVILGTIALFWFISEFRNG